MLDDKSIRTKLLLVSSCVVVFAVLSTLHIARNSFQESAQFTRTNVESLLLSEAEASLANISSQISSDIGAFLNAGIATITTLASQIEHTALGSGGVPFSREQVKHLNETALKSNQNLSSIYSFFEPNGYDRSDILHAGNDAHSTPAGTLAIYFTLEDGSPVYYASDDDEHRDDSKDENGIRAAEWYLCPQETRKSCLLDPYLYEGELMTSFTAPVLVSGQFRGVVASDIILPLIQEEVTKIAGKIYNGTGQVSVLSQRQLLVASSAHPESLAKNIRSVDPKLADIAQRSGLYKAEESWHYILPIQINHVGAPWKVVISIPKQEIFAPAVTIREQLDKRITSTLTQLAVSGGVVTLLGVLIMLAFTQSVTTPIRKIADRMDELATRDGDLTQSLDVSVHAELINLASGFNLFAHKLRSMILDMQKQTTILLDSSTEVSSKITQVNTASKGQYAHVEKVADATNQMSTTTTEVADLANKTSSSSNEANENIEKSQSSLHKNKDHVNELNSMLEQAMTEVGKVVSRSNDINGILLTIRSIAEQTNLLALNAAIEAARAGEQGRGFAVVADEVRNLAARTQESTEEVERLVGGLQTDVNSAVKQLESSQEAMTHTLSITDESVQHLDVAAKLVKQINAYAREVSYAVEAQKGTSSGISNYTTEIGEESKALWELSEQTEEVTEQAHQAALALAEQLKSFKV